MLGLNGVKSAQAFLLIIRLPSSRSRSIKSVAAFSVAQNIKLLEGSWNLVVAVDGFIEL